MKQGNINQHKQQLMINKIIKLNSHLSCLSEVIVLGKYFRKMRWFELRLEQGRWHTSVMAQCLLGIRMTSFSQIQPQGAGWTRGWEQCSQDSWPQPTKRFTPDDFMLSNCMQRTCTPQRWGEWFCLPRCLLLREWWCSLCCQSLFWPICLWERESNCFCIT